MIHVQKIITIILMITLVGCSSVPHKKASIYGKTLNSKEEIYDNNKNIK